MLKSMFIFIVCIQFEFWYRLPCFWASVWAAQCWGCHFCSSCVIFSVQSVEKYIFVITIKPEMVAFSILWFLVQFQFLPTFKSVVVLNASNSNCVLQLNVERNFNALFTTTANAVCICRKFYVN